MSNMQALAKPEAPHAPAACGRCHHHTAGWLAMPYRNKLDEHNELVPAKQLLMQVNTLQQHANSCRLTSRRQRPRQHDCCTLPTEQQTNLRHNDRSLPQTQHSGQRAFSPSILTYLPHCTRQHPHQCLLGPGLHAHIHHPPHCNPQTAVPRIHAPCPVHSPAGCSTRTQPAPDTRSQLPRTPQTPLQQLARSHNLLQRTLTGVYHTAKV